MLNLLTFFTMSSTGLRGHELKLYKPQAHLDIRKKFLPSESLMSGIDCLSHYCTVVRYQHLKRLDCYLKNRGYDYALVSLFPLVSHLSRWLVELS